MGKICLEIKGGLKLVSSFQRSSPEKLYRRHSIVHRAADKVWRDVLATS